jgi:protein-L-isoaspartate O-methyltransferase
MWRPLLDLASSGQLQLAGRILALAAPFHRLSFLAGASSCGLLRLLADGPRPFAELAAELAPDPAMHDALRSWLRFGVRVGELAADDDEYALAGFLAHRLAEPEGDAWAALVLEMATLHHRLLVETPARLARGALFTLADQDGAVVARSSRVLEPMVGAAVDAFVPPKGALRLLEVGCGSGVHVRRALARNPALTALAIDLQPEVADRARANLARWKCAARVTVETGDLRARPAKAEFDLLTLHNNIYYFPVAERPAVLGHARAMLRDGGRLLLTTGCAGGSPAMHALDLWAAATAGCGRLPKPEELVAQLGEAGFRDAKAERLVPGESFFAFTARA